MYRYTPKPGYVKTVRRPEYGYRPSHWATVERFITKHFDGPSDDQRYTIHTILVDHYASVTFYSETKAKAVPIRGVLFPVALFDETVVETG